MGAIKDVNIKLWTEISQLLGKISKNWLVRIMHANFQASSFTGVGVEWGDRLAHMLRQDPYTKFLNFSLASLGMDN